MRDALGILVIAAALAGLPALGAQEKAAAPSADTTKPDAAAKSNAEFYEQMQSFVDLLDQVERNYVEGIDRKVLLQAAIDGVLEKLDPYSNYIAPEEMSQFETALNHQFGGIGIQIAIDKGQLKVMSPLYGTPAYRAGVHAGDAILEVDGKSTKGFSNDDAIKALKGEPGTDVKLKIQSRSGPPRELTLTREIIKLETVLGDHRKLNDQWDFMLDPAKRIGYVRLDAFGRETADQLRDALIELQAQDVRGLVLDLRFNPGGLLSSAVEVADLFIPTGRIVSTSGRNVKEQAWEARPEGTFESFPMVVLVNHYSASASEVVSACLQDHKRATVVGERTWGKGSVQNVVELQGGRAALKLTTAGYKRPSGKNIHRLPGAKDSDEWGVTPDVLVKTEGTDLWRLQSEWRKREMLQPHEDEAAEAADDAKPKDKSGDGEKQEDSPSRPAGDEDRDEKQDQDEKPFVDAQLQKALEILDQALGGSVTAQKA